MFVLYLSYPINNSRNLTHYVKVEVTSLVKVCPRDQKGPYGLTSNKCPNKKILEKILLLKHEHLHEATALWTKKHYLQLPLQFFYHHIRKQAYSLSSCVNDAASHLCFCIGNFSLHIRIFYFFPNIITIIPRDRKTSHLKFLFSPLQHAVRLIFRVFIFSFTMYSSFDIQSLSLIEIPYCEKTRIIRSCPQGDFKVA